MMPVLEVENLEKVFVRGFFRKRTQAIDGLTFQVEAGEVFGFLGPNGAGKTTTMKILMGLIFPTGGHATIFGVPAGNVQAKRRLGYLPENPYFYDHLSATELLHMVGKLYGQDRRTRVQRSGELLERVGLGMAAARSMRSYSKGMLQRVGLAQALMGDPDLVVLDEPMSGLDPIGRREVRDLIVDLRKRGKTVFFSTHILADAEFLCDRVAIVVKGKLVDVGMLGKLLSPQVLEIPVTWSGTEEHYVELRAKFSGHHKKTSEGYVFTTDSQEQVNRFIGEVVAHRGSVLAVSPHRQTLDDLFAQDAAGPAEALRS